MPLNAISPIPLANPAKIGDLTLDALIEEAEEKGNTVTQFPVEDGSQISDHVVKRPDVLMIRGVVTNAPIRSHGGPADAQARATIPVLDHVVGTSINYAELALAYLRELVDLKKTVDVVTRRGRFSNMQVTKFSRSKTKDTGDALVFSIEMVQVTRVKLLFVASGSGRRTKSGRAQPRTDSGKNTAQKASSDDPLRSILKKGKNAGKAFISNHFK